jgi:hypothetical protein
MLNLPKRDLTNDEAWLSYSGALLAHFMSLFPPETQPLLDYSPASLVIVENWLCDRYEDYEDTLYEADEKLYPAVVMYVGETFRRNLKGHWVRYLSDEDESFPYDEKTIVEGDFVEGFCVPHQHVKDVLYLHHRDAMRRGLEKWMEESNNCKMP